MVDSLVFFIPVIAIKVKSVSEEIQSVWCLILGKTRKACTKVSIGLLVLCSIRTPSFVLKNDDFQVRQWKFYDNKDEFSSSKSLF
ncbi:hypothetical protein MEC_01365 [Bartonella alsatica IBS 382]|uniref:Uncharacterized protein n=1 Tax=Bartonella alsatica IBS 382 TaxID=1094551 RepID=J0YI16_9HYPH|nr:hypothetical protein MEC_01365 [Bartonella alsatica IBS 382]